MNFKAMILRDPKEQGEGDLPWDQPGVLRAPGVQQPLDPGSYPRAYTHLVGTLGDHPVLQLGKRSLTAGRKVPTPSQAADNQNGLQSGSPTAQTLHPGPREQDLRQR